MEVISDHVHLLLDINFIIIISVVIARIKCKTAHILNREFPELTCKLTTLWTRSKFVATVGSVFLEVVKNI